MPINIVDGCLVFTGVNGSLTIRRGGISTHALDALATAIESGTDFEMENSSYVIMFYSGDMSVGCGPITVYLNPDGSDAIAVRRYIRAAASNASCALFCVCGLAMYHKKMNL